MQQRLCCSGFTTAATTYNRLNSEACQLLLGQAIQALNQMLGDLLPSRFKPRISSNTVGKVSRQLPSQTEGAESLGNRCRDRSRAGTVLPPPFAQGLLKCCPETGQLPL